MPEAVLNIKGHCRRLVSRHQKTFLRVLHGFSPVTVEKDLSGINRVCPVHRYIPYSLPFSILDAYLEQLLDQLDSEYPEN